MNKISIILPTYNSINYIKKAIDSIFKQTYKNWELIIIDDKSSDKTKEFLIRKYFRFKKVKLIFNKKNMGPGKSRNLGLKKVTGTYIAFIDSDDLWKKNKLKKQLNFMLKHKYQFTYTNILYKKNEGLMKRLFPLSYKTNYSNLIYHNIITTSSVMIENKIIKDNKIEFNSSGYDDFSFWLKILKYTRYSYLLNNYLTIYNTNINSVSRNKIKSLLWIWNIYYKENKLGVFISIIYCIINIFLSNLKKICYVKA